MVAVAKTSMAKRASQTPSRTKAVARQRHVSGPNALNAIRAVWVKALLTPRVTLLVVVHLNLTAPVVELLELDKDQSRTSA